MISTRLVRTLSAGSLLVLSAVTASAEQSLIPTPYPSAPPGGTPLDPVTPDATGPQTIMKDPYPEVTGANSQGNPPTSRGHRHQHLIPSVNQRKYRVDEPAR